jgi:hypothetical protein
MATKVLIHNGCTTGVEAYAMGVPAISYRVTVNECYDNGFYRLPNLLSHQCFDFEDLRETVQSILAGKLGAADGDERKSLIDHHLAAQDGPLACERMVDVLEGVVKDPATMPEATLRERLDRWCISKGLHLAKRYKSYLPGPQHKPEFQRHRYPGVSLDEVRERVARIRQVLGENGDLKVEEVFDQIYRISR